MAPNQRSTAFAAGVDAPAVGESNGIEIARPNVRTVGRLLVLSLRPKQWTKNAALFLALFFSINLYWSPSNWNQIVSKGFLVSLGFVAFCLVSGAIYLINDIFDAERDRIHPLKRKRPIASGRLPRSIAQAAAPIILVVGFGLSSLVGWQFLFITMAYAVLMATYSARLKHIVFIDVLSIAGGFVLRIVAGAAAIDVPVSPWLYLCTILGALFIGFAKRRHEIVLLSDQAVVHRQILSEYSPQLLDQAIAVVTSSLVMAYSLYTFSAANLPSNRAMMATIPFVIYGIFRYLYLTYQRQEGGSPEDLILRDRPLIATIVLWLLVSVVILFIFRHS